jgi:aminoglycoside phosphotransferase (APT) family kinase protein
MRYIAANTTIPVPHVYDIGVHSNGLKSIVMDHINGLTLHDAWSNMIPSQKILVAEQIRGYILQLRELKPHSESTSLRSRNQGIYSLNYFPNPEHQTQLNEQLFARMTPLVPDILQPYAPPNRKDKLVFTHGDLAPRNIVVDGEAHVTAILDWEYAGWYPQWWEAVKAYQFCNDVPGWKAYLSAILPPDHEMEYMAVAFAAHSSR